MRKNISSILCFVFFISCIRLQGQSSDISYMSSGGKLKPLQAIMDIRHYTIALDVDIAGHAIDGYAEIDLLLSQASDTLLFDLVHFLTVRKVTVDHVDQSFFQQDDHIFIVGRQGFKPGKQTVHIEYGGKPPVAVRPPWKGGFTWTKDSQGNPWVVINCQMEGGKIYYPCKDHPSDEPNEGADLLITVPKGLAVAGPGLLESVRDTGNARVTYHWKTRYTISNYCIVFNIGKYEVVSRPYKTIDGNTVPMQFYVLQEDTAFAKHVLDLREQYTRVLEKYFGEYPWVREKIGIAEVPNPGMEHQTMITYGDKFKYQQLAGGDYSPNLFHEFCHEWWANKVTNKDWAHMWIQEGITTYAEALFFREVLGERGYDSIIAGDRMNIENRKPVVQGEAVNTIDTYTRDVYFKGAFFMHTLRYIVGDSLFFPTLRKLATDPKYTYDHFVTTDDVEALFSAQSGKDLRPLFDFYLRTTAKLDIVLTSTGFHTYAVQVKNISMPLPIELITSSGPQHIMLSGVPTVIKSDLPPVIDPAGYYLKKVTIE
jgi:aminopeptidase N